MTPFLSSSRTALALLADMTEEEDVEMKTALAL